MPCSDTWLGDRIVNGLNLNLSHIIKGMKTRGPTITIMTIRRLLFSRKTLVLLFLCSIPIIIALYWFTRDEENAYLFFSNMIFVSFLFFIVLIVSLLYGVSVFNDDITGFAYSECTTTNGADIRFADSDGTTILNHEIEEWATNTNSYVWVQVPVFTKTVEG